jgi:hypothetical protein
MLVGSWGITSNDVPLGIDMLCRARDRYPWSDMQTHFPFTEYGVAAAVQCAMEMKCVKATIVPNA